jgi:polysaccharide export outer membrane protein
MGRGPVKSLVFFLWIMLVPVLSAQTPGPAETSSTPLYVIQPNDVLRIFVFNHPEVSGQTRVRPDGRISLPLVQDIQAAGRNPMELKQKLEERIREYIDGASVTVIVDAIESYRIYVTGLVTRPGAITTERPVTVLQALALAGGLLELAKPAEIVIIRTTGEGTSLFRFNYPEFIKGGNFNQNMVLKSGDTVVVP